MPAKFCPLCNKEMTLNQINFTSAIFICADLTCPYPVGFQCIEVQRNYKDMNKELNEDDPLENGRENGYLNVDHLLGDILNASEPKQSQFRTTTLAENKGNDEKIQILENLLISPPAVEQGPEMDKDFDEMLQFLDILS